MILENIVIDTSPNATQSQPEEFKGALIGHAKNNTTISNVKLKNIVSSGWNNELGAIVGRMEDSKIEYSHVSHGSHMSGGRYVGGLVGYMGENPLSQNLQLLLL